MKTFIFRPFDPAAETEGFGIQCVGLHEKMPPCIVDRPEGTGDYLLMLFYDPVFLEAEGELVKTQPDSLMIWSPRAGHRYGWPHASWDHSWTHCFGDDIARFLEENGIETGRVYPLCDPSLVEKSLMQVFEELSRFERPSAVLCRNCYENMFIEIGRSLRGAGGKAPPRLLKIKRAMMENPAHKFTLADLAQEAHLSVPHFCSLWKNCFHSSPIDYLIQLRMHRAAYLLGNRNLSIARVAEMSGYGDVYYFSRHFKRHYGESPGRLRRRTAPDESHVAIERSR